MALTIAIDNNYTQGNKHVVSGRIAFDSAYPVGGEALSAASIGLGRIDDIAFTSNGRLGYIYYTDSTLPGATSINVEVLCPTGGTAPVSVADPAVNTMASGGTSIGATAVDLVFTIGNGGRGIEIGASDCSSLTNIRFIAWGT